MRKLIVLLLLFTVGSLWIGLSNLWDYFRYPEPVAVAYDQPDVAGLPTYVKLQKIRLLGTEALWTNSRKGTKIFIPIHPSGDQSSDRVSVILESDDPDLLVAAARVGGKHRLEQELKLLQLFAQKTEVAGMIHSSPADQQLDADLRKLTPLLSEDYIILREGDRPSLGLGVIGIVVGSIFLVLLNWIRTRPSRLPTTEPPLITPALG